MRLFGALPTISFAYTFHANIFPIWREMSDTSTKGQFFNSLFCLLDWNRQVISTFNTTHLQEDFLPLFFLREFVSNINVQEFQLQLLLE
jgi:hypothetical protein